MERRRMTPAQVPVVEQPTLQRRIHRELDNLETTLSAELEWGIEQLQKQQIALQEKRKIDLSIVNNFSNYAEKITRYNLLRELEALAGRPDPREEP